MTAHTHARIDAALQATLRLRTEAILAHWCAGLQALGGNHVRGLVPQTELDVEMRALLNGLDGVLGGDASLFDRDASHPLAVALRAASQLRAARGYTPEETLQYIHACKEAWVGAAQADPALAGDQQAAQQRIGRLMDRCVLVLVSAFIAARDDILLRQTASLREVATPVITLWDSMLLLPLVGIVDSVRAQQISERLLEAISQAEAEVTLIDVTGVPVMDTSVARHILKTVTAAEMLGTRVILTGISPSTAQTMVKLGIAMSGVPTRASLKGGVALAMTLTHRRVVDLPGATASTPVRGLNAAAG
jgi:rsbT co-antagonist protein RsbR